jgi:hypothetical protein
LEAVNNVILRDGDINAVLLPLSVLIFTGAALWAASILVSNKQQQSI